MKINTSLIIHPAEPQKPTEPTAPPGGNIENRQPPRKPSKLQGVDKNIEPSAKSALNRTKFESTILVYNRREIPTEEQSKLHSSHRLDLYI